MTFEKYYDGRIHNITIALSDRLQSDFMGVCYYRGSNEISAIYINRYQWNISTNYQREILILHELAHCILNRSIHTNDFSTVEYIGYGTDGYGNERTRVRPYYFVGDHHCPSSIMRWYMFNKEEVQKCYIPYREYYLNELFEKEAE